MKHVRTLTLSMTLFLTLISSPVMAGPPGWYWSLGYHNPINAAVGFNLMRLWHRWAVEFGVGYLDSTNSNTCDTEANNSSVKCYFTRASSTYANLEMAGGVNVKYLLGNANIRPYIQVGSHAGASMRVGSTFRLSGAVGSGYSGVGFFIMGENVDFYLSYVLAGSGLLQFGFNF